MKRSRPPSIRLRRLAAELKRLRVAAALRQEEVAEQTGLDASSIYRIERAMNKPQRRTVTTLLDLYGVTDPGRRATLLDWLKDPGQQTWIKEFTPELPEIYGAYVGFEHEAESLRWTASMFVPALLQTEEYARALLSEGAKVVPTDVAQRATVRMHRQSILYRPIPARLWVILDEAVLRRVVGSPELMHRQLDKLVASAGRPNIRLQVVPFSEGVHLGMEGDFVMLDFADPNDPPLVYADGLAGVALREKAEDVARFAAIFDTIAEHALPPGESRTMIESAARALV
ncbi:helix-turn-helix transcriptional regulator [Actinoplanes sp. NPDC024001]|uniref:helix-turn-helix domain-containing protein n=1 Tax=Actinoplanes sp. NPDC024001 TaxID=3154598 RepID=UPI00340249D4